MTTCENYHPVDSWHRSIDCWFWAILFSNHYSCGSGYQISCLILGNHHHSSRAYQFDNCHLLHVLFYSSTNLASYVESRSSYYYFCCPKSHYITHALAFLASHMSYFSSLHCYPPLVTASANLHNAAAPFISSRMSYTYPTFKNNGSIHHFALQQSLSSYFVY